MKKNFKLRDGKKIKLGGKTLVMGILNVTPDSFSDGGKYFSTEAAIARAVQLIEYGADIIDIGAESTRPHAVPVSADEEFARIEKILPAIVNLGVPVSIDTYKPEVAAQVLELGASIINDVHGLEDSRMIDVAKRFGAPVVAMHSEKCSDGDIIADVKKFFRRTLALCTERGLDTKKIIFDPGIGFGKTFGDDLTILRRLDELKTLDDQQIFLMVGVSRKRVIGRATKLRIDERDEATGALCVHAIANGADIVRVHNVKMISRMRLMTDRLLKGGHF